MVRRHTTLLRLVPALTLTLASAVVAEPPSRATAAQLPEVPAPPMVGGLPEPSGVPPEPTHPRAEPAPLDPHVRRAAAPIDKDPLPPALQEGGATPSKAARRPDEPEGYARPTERLPLGKQAAGLSVEVIAPGVLNVGKPGTIKIIVRNTGVADAAAVNVRYDLPRELGFVSATPEPKRLTPDDPALSWPLNTLAAGSEQVIVLKVKPTGVAEIDHTALVSLMVGARSRTVVQEPMLKVEQTVAPARVLKGQQVQFRIAVSNPGSGPARDVVVQAKLSSGLRSDGDEVVSQTIPVLQAKERVELDPLVADTIAGGEQTCAVTAYSDDVAQAPADAKVVRSVVVLRPELKLTLSGPRTRYTDTLAEYHVILENPGTAAARNVRVSVHLPASGGKLKPPLPSGAEWNAATQRLTWVVPTIEPSRGDVPSRVTSTFRVRLGGISLYRIVAEARAADVPPATGDVSTDVSGMADVELDVTERKRVLDVGESTIFDVRMKNVGTKAAKSLLVKAKLTGNVEVTDTAGTDAEARFDEKTGDLIFPPIDALAPGRELELSVKVKATRPGVASCRVKLLHDDLPDAEAGVEAIANTRITPDSRLK